MLPVNQKIFDEWVGPAVDVKPIYNCKTLHESGGIAFELYKEAWRVGPVCARISFCLSSTLTSIHWVRHFSRFLRSGLRDSPHSRGSLASDRPTVLLGKAKAPLVRRGSAKLPVGTLPFNAIIIGRVGPICVGDIVLLVFDADIN